MLNGLNCANIIGRTWIVGKGGLWVRQILLMNNIYLKVRNVAWFHIGGKWWMFCASK